MVEKKIMEKNYKLLCKMLDDKGWKYDTDAEKYKISCDVEGENGTYSVRMYLDDERAVAITWVFIDLKVPSSMQETMSLAINAINSYVIHGVFDYGQEKGNLLYRCTSTFRESIVSEEWFEYLLDVACVTTDNHLSKLRRLVKGYLTLDELIEELEK